MNKWQIANYLIEAKKEVDSLWYIAINENKINMDIEYIVNNRRKNFYINTTIIIEEFVKTKNKKLKKELCNNNKNIEKLFQYRDKHIAHKDDNYKHSDFFNYSSIMEIVNECKIILQDVKNICQEILPDNITLDFICYDPNLFRTIYNISRDLEEKIRKNKRNNYTNEFKNILKKYDNNINSKNILKNPELSDEYKNKDELLLLYKEGLTIQEKIQNTQDFYILGNSTNDNKSLWQSLNDFPYYEDLMAVKLGYIDIFERELKTNKTEKEKLNDMKLIQSAKTCFVYDLRIKDEAIMEAIKNEEFI